ncbi:UPF0481 protein At3g47200-like [Alnus glutinosa]|uniref:UPF0481 protein At3g47200-like n=1 Tax=Alnus glutinosa TaxID=3517 RepID=UPI002D7925FF|nr:UPF0481 protein At3g47200-like [Alnus glutinosa]
MASDFIGEELESNDVLIDVPLVMEPPLWPECCIYPVPKNLRKINKEAYTPKLVSIGPFHHGLKELRDMEKHKLRYFKDFLYRTRKSQEDLLKIIQDNEVKIRHCYSEDSKLSSTDFVKMILLDAIFIIELFVRFHIFYVLEVKVEDNENELFVRTREKENDYMSSQPWLEGDIRHDLILLENQLPFFVLEQLYTFAFSDSSDPVHQLGFIMHSACYFSTYIYREFHDDMQLPEEFNNEEVKHFTDLIRYVFCSVPDLKLTDYLDDVYCATKLDEAGLKFKAVENRSLLNIRFHRNKWLNYCPFSNLSWLLACLPCLKSVFPGLERMQSILEVPPLKIHDSTEALFRNLMALEQCHYPSHTYICNYVMLLDYLIDTERDVDLLVEKKIIVNNIGSNVRVANLINKLCLQIVKYESCYSVLGKEINKYCDNHWNRIMATMKSVYFRDFWRGTATMVALIVLGFTLWNFLKPNYVMIK